MPEDWEGQSISSYLESVTEAVKDLGWRVEQTTEIGLYSFYKLVIYQDLDKNPELIAQHPIIQRTAGDRSSDLVLDWLPEEHDVDKLEKPDQTYQVLDADSSQRICIDQVRDAWYNNWHQQAWFDDVQLYGGYNHPPNPPYNPSPPDGVNDQPTGLTLGWSCSDPDGDEIAYHHVYFGPSSPPEYNTTITTDSLPRSGLTPETTYFWMIVAEDEYGANTTGPEWNFTTGQEQPPNQPPYEPGNPFPANNATSQPTTITLSWSGGDPDGNETVVYDVYFDLAYPPGYKRTVTDTSTTMTDLYHGQTYHWQIISRDTGGEETEGGNWNFTTNHPPNSPSNPSPSDLASTPRPLVDLDWSCTDPDGDSLTYKVYCNELNPPTKLVYEGQDSNCTARANYTVRYYWKVVASDGIDSETGPVWRFDMAMGYGYMQVIDSGIGQNYSVPDTDYYHIQKAASQSNVIVVPDKVYDASPTNPWYNESYPVGALQNDLGIIFDVTGTLRWIWFDSGYEYGQMIGAAESDLDRYKANLADSGVYDSVQAVWVFDEPVSFYDGNQMNLSILTTMRDIAGAIFSGKHLFLNFYRVGDQRAGGFQFWEDDTASYYTAAVENGVLGVVKTGTGLGVQNVTSRSIYSLGRWKGSDINLSLSYKAVSDVAAGNNAHLDLLHENGTMLATFTVYSGGSTDTNWVDWPPQDVTSYLQGPDGLIGSVKIRVWVQDYSEDCMHEVYFDNVRLYPVTEPDEQPIDWFDPFDYDNVFASYDTIASSYIMGDDWVAIDPYVYPLYPRSSNQTYYPYWCIGEDITWAYSEMSTGAKLIIFGQAYDPPEQLECDLEHCFFEDDNNQSGSMISPGNYTLDYYFDRAWDYAAALIWFWYPDSYASSFYHDPDLCVNNMWAKQQELWEYVELP